MSSFTSPLSPEMLLIDDDDLSRELLAMLATEAGYSTNSFASGDEALAHLSHASVPSVILIDMQMPGLSGNALGQRLRALCGSGTKLLAMSGSMVAPADCSDYDGFLLKPFAAEDLQAACQGDAQAISAKQHASSLDEAIYAKFAAGMPAAQLHGLYKMCLDDALKRLGTLQTTLAAGDDDAYRRIAHAIKGGCSMVGAAELASLAAAMETEGITNASRTLLDSFEVAAARLQRMLESKAGGL